MANFIPDGYTISGKINSNPDNGISDMLFSYRPATGAETNAWLADKSRGDGKTSSEATSKYLADHIVKWDITHNGQAVPITVDNCKRVHHPLMNRLADIISGYEQPDEIDGEKPQSETDARGN